MKVTWWFCSLFKCPPCSVVNWKKMAAKIWKWEPLKLLLMLVKISWRIYIYITNCPQIILSEDVTVFWCVRNSLVLYFWGRNSVGADIWRPGRHTSPREARTGEVRCILHHLPTKLLGNNVSSCKKCNFSKQVVRTASTRCSFLNKVFGKDISVRKMFEVRCTHVNLYRSLSLYINCISIACLLF